MQQQAKGFSAAVRRGLGVIVHTPIRKWKAWRQRRKTLHTLRRLSEHQLKDIGLTSHDVDRFR